MSSEIPKLFAKHRQTCVMLKNLIEETLEALNDIGPNIKISQEIEGIIKDGKLDTIKKSSEREPIIVVDGQDNHAKAILVNHILGEDILPTLSSHWRAVYLKYGPAKILRTMWNIDFEVVNGTRPYQPFSILTTADLYRYIDECAIDDPWFYAMEAELPNPILKDNMKILVIPDCTNYRPNYLFWRGLEYHLKDHTPVILYAIHGDEVKPNSMPYIEKFQRALRVPFLFVCIATCNETSTTDSLTESLQHSVESRKDLIYKKLKTQLFFLDTEIIKTDEIIQRENNNIVTPFNMVTSFANFDREIAPFTERMLKLYTLNLARKLSEIHNKCVKRFILSAFDMAREIQITPKRLYYARAEEQRLYLELKVYADDQQNCLTELINDVVQEMKMNMEEFLTEFDQIYNASDNHDRTTYEAKIKIQDLILQRLRNGVAQRLGNSIACLQECVTGTLERCLKNIEKACDSLESNASASNALKQILTAAYNIDVKATTSFSVVHIFLNRCKKLFTDYISPVYGNIWPLSDREGAPTLEFKLRTLTNMMRQLSRGKLAKSISSQFRDQIKSSHDAFLLAVRLLDNQLSGRLEQTEEQRVLIRKKHAPKFARLALESTSLCDFIIHGMPKLLNDIGRGQYGVVYSCEPWGGIEVCALKSVVPPDDRHWNDLAMEFYYTRSIPEHPRILKLRGSVIDYNYAGGSSPAVLLIMERMFRDLHCGIRQGLDWLPRLQIAIDVVAGLRFLHSQGLVHRDIKLKNVLLDKSNRGKLTDFGFCIPEAMMSGSIVGTPVHMAPELLLGRYDSSVDVYAFGILFWYICSGQVKLPNKFDQFQNKEQLWNHVRRGIRPECLPQFNKSCWNLMEKCWAGEPSDRPLLGDVEQQLEAIYQSSLENTDANK